MFEIEVHRPFPEHFKVDDFRKFVISTLTDADPVKGPHPAITHCEGCRCDGLDNGLNPVGCPYCKQSAEIEVLRAERDTLAARLTAETSNTRAGAEYEYEVWQDGALQAGGRETDYASAKSEANHYAMMYAQDGPIEVRIYEKRLLTTQTQPKRRPYNASGSLSEYGVIPECDVVPAAQPAASDEHLIETGCYQTVIDRHSQPAANPEPSDEEILSMIAGNNHPYTEAQFINFARALLFRYGRPAGDADEYQAMLAVMEQIDPATFPGLTAAQRCALGRFAKPLSALPQR
ncbi:MAG TPA: hypothetical protein VIK69_02210 [Methylophilaceae bacterium]